MIYHINKKTKCGAEIAELLEIESDIKCKYCKINFTLMSNLTRHLKICKIKKKNEENENKLLIEKNKKLEEELRVANKSSRENEEVKILKEKLQKLENKQDKYEEIINSLVDKSDNKILGNTDIKSVRAQARMLYKKFSPNMICVHCKHSGSTQVCHIKAISDFNKLSLLEKVNHLSNLIGLCPNCHIDLDKHKKFEVSRTATLHTYIVKHLQNLDQITN